MHPPHGASPRVAVALVPSYPDLGSLVPCLLHKRCWLAVHAKKGYAMGTGVGWGVNAQEWISSVVNAARHFLSTVCQN